MIGHLEPDEADEVMKLARAMNDANFARQQAAWEKQQAAWERDDELFKQRRALFAAYPPGTTYGEIIADMKKKGLPLPGSGMKKGLRLVRTGKG